MFTCTVEYDTKKVWWFLVLNATFNNILVIYKKGEKTLINQNQCTKADA
jgi:hypothetical protein